LGISKRGDRSLRMLVISGVRARVHRARRKTAAQSRWIMSLEQRRGKKRAMVAIATTKARMAGTLLTSDAESLTAT
jgi:transposase